MGDMRDSDEFFDVAEKILEKFNGVYEKDNSLDEFDIVPVESQSNRSPVIHVNHKLALESWCVPFLYSHSFKCFTELLPKRNYSGRANSASTGRGSVGSLSGIQQYSNGQLTEEDRRQRKLELSRLLVLLNPDLTVAWNFRRDAHLEGWTRFQDEINLVSLVSSRKPKSFESFSYRKWLLKQLIASEELTKESWWQIFVKEIKVVEKAASAYYSNYHAWEYRRWLLETSLNSSFSSAELKQQVLLSEKTSSDQWLEYHVSDHSGIHYRQNLLVPLSQLEDKNSDVLSSLKVFKKELENNLSFIARYSGHEILWYHRRFLLQFTISRLQNHHRQTDNHHQNRMEVDGDEDLSSTVNFEEEIISLRDREQDLVDSVLTRNSSRIEATNVNFITKDTSQLDVLYARRHCKWLFLMFEWSIIDNSKE